MPARKTIIIIIETVRFIHNDGKISLHPRYLVGLFRLN